MKKLHVGGIGNMRNLLLAALLLGALARTAMATPYYVALPPAGNDDGTHDGLSWDEPLATISNALAKATTASDEVVVSNGTYTVTATLLVANAITLRSANNDREATIIDGANLVRCIQVSNNLAVVRGFTLRRGKHTAAQAGGIRLDAGTVDNCVVRECSPTGGSALGGGVYIAGADGNTAVITNCLITLNTCGGAGGGIYSAVNKSALITHSTISSNTVTANTGGGGIHISNSAGTLFNCVIEGNKTTGDWNYGAGYVSGGILRNCLIINNSALGYGGLYMTGGTNEN